MEYILIYILLVEKREFIKKKLFCFIIETFKYILLYIVIEINK